MNFGNWIYYSSRKIMSHVLYLCVLFKVFLGNRIWFGNNQSIPVLKKNHRPRKVSLVLKLVTLSAWPESSRDRLRNTILTHQPVILWSSTSKIICHVDLLHLPKEEGAVCMINPLPSPYLPQRRCAGLKESFAFANCFLAPLFLLKKPWILHTAWNTLLVAGGDAADSWIA